MIKNKMLYFTTVAFLISGLLGGVFYREYTKFMKFDTFNQNTTLGLLHTHLLILGVFFFLIVILLNKVYQLNEKKYFKSFYYVYVTGVSLTSIMLIVRGIVQINNLSLSDGMISGLAGLSHIILGVGFVLFFLNLYQAIKKEDI